MNEELNQVLSTGNNTPVVLIGTNGQTIETICSTEAAEMVEVEHSKLLRSIRTYCEYLSEAKIGLANFFIESQYIDEQKKPRPCYQITKKGCEMIANKLTGQKGVIFTAKYIDRFHEMQDYIKESKLDISKYSPEMQVLLKHDEKIQKVEYRLDDLEDNIHITRSQQKKLKQFANSVVISALGSRHSNAYKMFSGKAFSAFWRDYYNYFNVSSYLDTPKVKWQEALQFVNDWKPNEELKCLILGANTYVQQEIVGGQAL